MKTSSFSASVPATIAASSAALLIIGQLVSCGGDNASSQSNPSDASATDSTTTLDGSPPADGGGADGADASGSTRDADAGSQSDADAGSQPDGAGVVDGSDGASCAVAVPTASEFLSTIADKICQTLKGCCNTGSSFDTSGCLAFYDNPTFGGFLGVGRPVAYLDGGRIAYDTSAACLCLGALDSLSCGLLSQQYLTAVQQTCLEALHGTVPIAGTSDAGDAGRPGCASSYECVSGYCTANYPTDPIDASLGFCAPLVTDGGACSNQNQCSSLGNGIPALYCNGSICAPRLEAGAACGSTSQCSSNICQVGAGGGAPTCVSGEIFSSAATCAFFSLPDAGDGG